MALASVLTFLAALGAPQVAACEQLVGQSGTVTVDRASYIAPQPVWLVEQPALPVSRPMCRIEGRIEGSIGFELWLPAEWNGRMLGAGVGGPAGVFNYRDMAMRVDQGFATVTTDSGHKATNERWMREPQARVDYEHRAVHLTAEAAKALITRHYGQSATRSYFLGCSGGGRQALKEMQNYPGDYDGVIAGAPGPNMPLQSVRMLWFSLEQLRNPAGALREEDWQLYESAVIRQCDALDGVRDGIMENPAACHFSISSLQCRPGQSDNCLTAARAATLFSIVSPMPDEHGAPMDGGLFAGVRTRPGPPSPLLRALWADGVYDDPDWDAFSFARTSDLAAANRVMPELRADRTNIEPFLARGNKAIIYQGWQDPSTNAGPTIDYYARLAEAQGGAERLTQSVRLFMVPGMEHCRGGPGADLFGGSGQTPAGSDPQSDMLWALVRWVEQGEAPSAITAARREDGRELFTRRLCPFPQSARFVTGGDPARASSYTCENDPVLTPMLSRPQAAGL